MSFHLIAQFQRYKIFVYCFVIFTSIFVISQTIEKYRLHLLNNKGKEHSFTNEPINLFLRHIFAAKFDDNCIFRPTKVLKRLLYDGYGYSNFERFRNRLMYCLNKDEPINFKK